MIHSEDNNERLNSVSQADVQPINETFSQRSPVRLSAHADDSLFSTLHGALRCVKHVLWASWLNVAFLLVPVGILVNYLMENSFVIFLLNVLAMIPSCHILSAAIEDLSFHLEGVAGGITTVLLRNTALFVLCIFLITSEQIDVLGSLIYGSLPANLLFGTGLDFVVGGMQWHIQEFAIGPVQTMSSCLFLGISGLSIVTLSRIFRQVPLESFVVLVRGVALVSLVCYLGYLLYRLRTHPDLFLDPSLEQRIDTTDQRQNLHRKWLCFPHKTSAVCGVLLCTATLAINAKLATDRISESLGIAHVSKFAMGFVIFPIAINNSFSLFGLRRDSVDAYLIITLDRTVQLVLIYIPLFWLVFRNLDDLGSFSIETFASIALFLSAFVLARVASRGKADWFTGLVMIIVYITISIGAFLV